MNVYFTWPDGRFRYECRGCGACCKGHGIGLEREQLVQLVGKRPELGAFVRKRGDAITVFNPRDRCWFFEDDGLCRVEVEDGRAAKPAACRLFPFNRVFRAGMVTVVDYNSVICPVQLVEGGGVTHAEVIAEIESIRDPAIVDTPIRPDDALFERERAIAAEMFSRTTIDGELPAFEELTGLPWRLPADPRAALALTPSMRFNELYGPRNYAPKSLDRMWLAWLGFAALGETLARRALGLQELTTIWSEQASVMHALARWQDVPVLAPGRHELPHDPLARKLAQALVDNRKPRRTLGQIVRDLGASDPPSRIAALKQADRLLQSALSENR